MNYKETLSNIDRLIIEIDVSLDELREIKEKMLLHIEKRDKGDFYE